MTLAALLALLTTQLPACSCAAPDRLCERLSPNMAVFIGKPAAQTRTPHGGASVTFSVLEMLWGLANQRSLTVLLLDGYRNPSAEPEFLAVIPRLDGRYQIGYCEGFVLPVSHPFVDQFRRSAKARRPVPVTIVARSNFIPIAGTWFQLSGEGQTVQGIMREDEGYTIPSLRPGTYTVAATRPNFAQTGRAQTASILPESCSELRIGMRSNAQVEGVARTAAGAPLRHATLHLTGEAQSLSTNYFRFDFLRDRIVRFLGWPDASTVRRASYRAQTDANGQFAFPNVFPGWYYLSTDLYDNFPVTYYPGVPGWTNATQLAIREGEDRRNLDFYLPDFGPRR